MRRSRAGPTASRSRRTTNGTREPRSSRPRRLTAWAVPLLSYNGAWGLHGVSAEDAYLTRTRYWSDVFRSTSPVQLKTQRLVDRSPRRPRAAAGGRGRRSTSGHSSSPSAAAPSVEPIESSASTESTPRSPVCRRPMPSSSRSSSSGSMRTFESEPMHMPICRCAARVDGQEPVAEVRLRSSGSADARARVARAGRARAPSACVACTIVVRGAEAALAGEQLDRPEPVLGEALVDLARLLVGVDVQRQLVLAPRSGRARVERTRPGRRARSGGRRRRGCRSSRSASSSRR